jgi:hypothetical protein
VHHRILFSHKALERSSTWSIVDHEKWNEFEPAPVPATAFSLFLRRDELLQETG